MRCPTMGSRSKTSESCFNGIILSCSLLAFFNELPSSCSLLVVASVSPRHFTSPELAALLALLVVSGKRNRIPSSCATPPSRCAHTLEGHCDKSPSGNTALFHALKMDCVTLRLECFSTSNRRCRRYRDNLAHERRARSPERTRND